MTKTQLEFWENYEAESVKMHLDIAGKFKPNETQMVGCRVPKWVWHLFEVKCINNEQTMSEVMRSAIQDYIRRN